jgi:hypothetical protein
MTLNWTNGNGTSRLVLAREGAAVSALPTKGSTYIANAIFGSGSVLASVNYVVYAGIGNSVTVNGLTDNTTYHFQVFEFNGVAITSLYLTSTASGNPANQVTLCTTPVVNVTPSGSTLCTGNGSATANVVGGNSGYTFDWFDSTPASLGIIGNIANNLAAGSYSVVATKGICSSLPTLFTIDDLTVLPNSPTDRGTS